MFKNSELFRTILVHHQGVRYYYYCCILLLLLLYKTAIPIFDLPLSNCFIQGVSGGIVNILGAGKSKSVLLQARGAQRVPGS